MNTKNFNHKLEYNDDFISPYVEWINNVFNSDILINEKFLNIKDDNKGNKKRKLDKVENDICSEHLAKKNKILQEENGYRDNLVEETCDKEDSNDIKKLYGNKSDLLSNTNSVEVDDHKNAVISAENLFMNNDLDFSERNKKTNSYDVSEIESEEEDPCRKGLYQETIKKTNIVENLNNVHKTFQNIYDIHKLHQMEKEELSTNKNYRHCFNLEDDELSSFLIYNYTDDDDENVDDANNTTEDEIKTDETLHVSFNYDKFKKNIEVISEVDNEYYYNTKESERNENQKEKSVKLVNNNLSSNNENDMNTKTINNINNNINDGCNNLTNQINSDDNAISNNMNNDNNSVLNLKKNEKIVKQENFPCNKNLSNSFCFWDIENESYISRPLYVHNVNKKYHTLLEESEEMIKNYSSNQYSIKIVPRHLLYVLSQVASRVFFDPLYRKQLFFQF